MQFGSDGGIGEVLPEALGAPGEPGRQGGAVDVQFGRGGRRFWGVVAQPAGERDPQVGFEPPTRPTGQVRAASCVSGSRRAASPAGPDPHSPAGPEPHSPAGSSPRVGARSASSRWACTVMSSRSAPQQGGQVAEPGADGAGRESERGGGARGAAGAEPDQEKVAVVRGQRARARIVPTRCTGRGGSRRASCGGADGVGGDDAVGGGGAGAGPPPRRRGRWASRPGAAVRPGPPGGCGVRSPGRPGAGPARRRCRGGARRPGARRPPRRSGRRRRRARPGTGGRPARGPGGRWGCRGR